MSVTHIPDKTMVRLWVMAGGRCEYCNSALWRDDYTMAKMNRAYIAHIIADQPDGPRGDPVLSDRLKDDLSNLMLMCDTHHRLIDVEDPAGHSVARLQEMKEAHEARVVRVTGIRTEQKSEAILYGANVGTHEALVRGDLAYQAMLAQGRYPATDEPVMLGMVNSSWRDCSSEFWLIESRNLCQLFAEQVKPRLQLGKIGHISVFGLAPQPLLMLLGYLLCDISQAEVYQLHREPQSWAWQEHPVGFGYVVQEPVNTLGSPALVLSLSATVTDDRVKSVLGDAVSIWRITVATPHNDFLKSPQQLGQFRQEARRLLDRIKAVHGQDTPLHVFPAVPVAVAVDFGRIVMPKADMPMRVYDQNRGLGGFVHALDLNAPSRG